MYPVTLQIANKKIVIVGGGKIAYRKVSGLLQKGAQIVVISPTLNEEMQQLLRTETIQWQRKPFEASDVQDAFIVFAATNIPTVNEYVVASCSSNQLVNRCDHAQNSSFYVPAVYQNNDLTIAVNTNGVSPLLAKKIRDEAAAKYEYLTERYFLFLKKVRMQLKQLGLSAEQKNAYLQEVLDEKYATNPALQQQFLEQLMFNHCTTQS